MNNKVSKAVIILVIISLCISVASLIISILPKEESAKDIQYVLYLGTNDKDTNKPVYTPAESQRILKKMLISSMGGYTIQEANGGWIDNDGTEYQEYTLVVYLSNTTSKDVHALADKLIETFNQRSVLIQTNETQTEFYSGKIK